MFLDEFELLKLEIRLCNKRNTLNALAFELDYESKLLQLYKEIKNG